MIILLRQSVLILFLLFQLSCQWIQRGSYRIRLPTEKELDMKVSKTVRKMRYYESTLLSAYKVHIHA